jgi:hypothetical protein
MVVLYVYKKKEINVCIGDNINMSKLPGIKIRNIQTIAEQHGKLWHLTKHHFLTKKKNVLSWVLNYNLYPSPNQRTRAAEPRESE